MERHFKLTLLITVTAFVAQAQTEATRQTHFNLEENIALDEYDVVSYFEGKPAEGSGKFKYVYRGIIYYFSSEANLTKFKQTPERYEPAYGGWCAFAMGESGEKVKVDPETFKIYKGRLYLFYNFWGNNTLEDWNKDELKLKESADRNWGKKVQ
jgi:YHS domain-containing protein